MSEELPPTAIRHHTSSQSDDRPATYRSVFSQPEYRAVFFASALSWYGDYIARAAITALVFVRTHSVLASAAVFALSYVPWLAGGPVLAALADRYPYRRVMIVCDVARMCLVGLVALPEMPVPAMFGLMFFTALLNPPFEAARSALLPQVLTGDRYVLGLSVQTTASQAAQMLGYFTGGVLAALNPHVAMLGDALTFGISALMIGLFVLPRRPAVAPAERTRLLRETAEGIGVVFGHPVLRAIAILVFATASFAVVPEGLAAAWSAAMRQGGAAQGLIMAASPLGIFLGGLIFARLMPPGRRRRMIPWLAVAAPLVVVPAVLRPPLSVVLTMVVGVGFVIGGLWPAANGLFVQVLPSLYRARAFGVMQGGIQIVQGAAVFATGALAEFAPVPVVVGVWAAAGALLLLVVVGTAWPSEDVIDAARAALRAPAPGPAVSERGPAANAV